MTGSEVKTPVDYVDPNIGGIGHLLKATSPIVAVPHGMMQIAPVTAPEIKDRYLSDKIYGFPAGILTIMPAVGTVTDQLASTYDHDFETTTPYYYSVLLEDYETTVEYTVGAHTAFYRITFPATDSERVVLRLPDVSTVQTQGETALAATGTINDATSYIYAELSIAPRSFAPLRDGKGLVAEFDLKQTQQVDLKVGFSYISIDQAVRNLRQEIPSWDFAKSKGQARDTWNQALSLIEVTGGSERERTIFYTALYRTLLRMVNITEDGHYYSGYDRKVHSIEGHDFYIQDQMWDTYRSAHPLLLIIEPKQQLDMVNSYVRMYEQGGWLPSFPYLMGDRAAMLGHHAMAFITDAYMKGYHDFNIEKAYEGMRYMAMEATMLPWYNGPLTELDRVYLEKGFFPALAPEQKEWVPEVHRFERRQAVAVTLEHAYDDWCLAQMAEALGKTDDHSYFMKRAHNYQNLFDKRINFMAPKTADGEWVAGFNPKLGGGQGGRDYFAECNSWVYTFHVQHDIAGLIGLFGGRENFLSRMDQLFVEQYDVSKYMFLNQFPDATGLIGQYCQGNEPAFHIPYLFNYAGQPWKTQRRLREIMRLWYHTGPLGLCGDEDGGAMSSWYVFSAMGFYPVCPGRPVYDIGSPVFDTVKINLPDGNTFTIEAENAAESKYINSASLQGQPLEKPWFTHADLVRGGSLRLKMSPRPNKDWGAAPEAAPPSMTKL